MQIPADSHLARYPGYFVAYSFTQTPSRVDRSPGIQSGISCAIGIRIFPA
jgi:hypothetical protein